MQRIPWMLENPLYQYVTIGVIVVILQFVKKPLLIWIYLSTALVLALATTRLVLNGEYTEFLVLAPLSITILLLVSLKLIPLWLEINLEEVGIEYISKRSGRSTEEVKACFDTIYHENSCAPTKMRLSATAKFYLIDLEEKDVTISKLLKYNKNTQVKK